MKLPTTMIRSTFSVLVLVLMNACPNLLAQSKIEDAIIKYNAEAVRGYVKPVADLLGTDMNAGFYHSASIPSTGFHLEISVVGMGAVVGADQETYMAASPQGFDPPTFETATIFGNEGGTVTDASTGLQYRGSDGILNTSVFTIGVLQVSVGYVLGTEAIVRFNPAPSFVNAELPKSSFVGVGLRHSISQYIPESPLDIAFGGFYNTFTVGDIIDFNSIAAGIQTGKTWSIFSLYGGVQWEKSTMHLSYTSSDPTATSSLVDFDFQGENNVRFTVGAEISLIVLHLFADANFGPILNFSGGVGFGI